MILNKKNILYICLFLTVFIAFTCVNTVNAANTDKIYVDTHGKDSYNGLAPIYNNITGDGPKKTIKNATSVIQVNGTIYLAKGTYNEHNIMITKNMKISGQDQKNTIINGKSKSQIFTVEKGIKLILNNLTLTQGKNRDGGAIHSSGTLTIDNCTFQNNKGYSGGAIKIDDTGIVNIANSTFTKNQATWEGGAIYNTGNLNITNCTFTKNQATCGGGAIYNTGNLNITNCTFTNNQATCVGPIDKTWKLQKICDGGSIYNAGILNIANSTFTQNLAFNSGGAIYNNNNPGGIYDPNHGKMNIANSTFTNNGALCDGGAIYNKVGMMNIGNSTFTKNRATNGGAISSTDDVNLEMHSRRMIVNIADCTFTQNQSYYGGAIDNNGKLNIANSTFTQNKANSKLDYFSKTYGTYYNGVGGAICNLCKSELTLDQCIFTNNKAKDSPNVYNSYDD